MSEWEEPEAKFSSLSTSNVLYLTTINVVEPKPNIKQSATTIGQWITGTYGGGQDSASTIYPCILDTNKGTFTNTIAQDRAEMGTVHYSWWKTFISYPLQAQTITGNATITLALDEENALHNLMPRVYMYVWKNDDTGIRGTLCAETNSPTEATVGYAKMAYHTITMTSTTIADRDRLVMELMGWCNNTRTSSYNHGVRFGDSGVTSDSNITFSNSLLFITEVSQTSKTIYSLLGKFGTKLNLVMYRIGQGFLSDFSDNLGEFSLGEFVSTTLKTVFNILAGIPSITTSLLLNYPMKTIKNISTVLANRLRTTIEKTILLLFALKSYAGKTILLLFRNRMEFKRTFLFLSKNLSKLEKSLSGIFNIRKRTLSSILVKYNLRNRVLSSILFRSNIRNRMLSILKEVYGVRGLAKKAVSILHNISSRANKNVQMVYSSKKIITKSLTGLWNIAYEFVEKIASMVLNYSIKIVKKTTFIIPYSLHVIRNRYIALLYQARSRLSSKLVLGHRLRSISVKVFIELYTILSGLKVVSKSFSFLSKLMHSFDYYSQEVTCIPKIIHRAGTESSQLRIDFYDVADLSAGSYTCDFWVRDPDGTTIGPFTGTVVKVGSKVYYGYYDLDPSDSYILGKYDLKARVRK